MTQIHPDRLHYDTITQRSIWLQHSHTFAANEASLHTVCVEFTKFYVHGGSASLQGTFGSIFKSHKVSFSNVRHSYTNGTYTNTPIVTLLHTTFAPPMCMPWESRMHHFKHRNTHRYIIGYTSRKIVAYNSVTAWKTCHRFNQQLHHSFNPPSYHKYTQQPCHKYNQ